MNTDQHIWLTIDYINIKIRTARRDVNDYFQTLYRTSIRNYRINYHSFGVDKNYNVVADGKVLVPPGKTPNPIASIEWIFLLWVSELLSPKVLIHAAAVSKNDSLILIPAESLVGKTTLTLGLNKLGWKVFADDITILDTKNILASGLKRSFHVRDGQNLSSSLVHVGNSKYLINHCNSKENPWLSPKEIIILDAYSHNSDGRIKPRQALEELSKFLMISSSKLPDVFSGFVDIVSSVPTFRIMRRAHPRETLKVFCEHLEWIGV